MTTTNTTPTPPTAAPRRTAQLRGRPVWACSRIGDPTRPATTIDQDPDGTETLEVASALEHHCTGCKRTRLCTVFLEVGPDAVRAAERNADLRPYMLFFLVCRDCRTEHSAPATQTLGLRLL